MTSEEKIRKAKVALNEALEGKAIGGNERIVRRWGDGETIFNFAWCVPGANIEKLQEALISRNEPFWACKFAEKIDGADIAKLQYVVINSGNISACCAFAKYVKGADIDKLAEVLLKQGTEYEKAFFNANVKK